MRRADERTFLQLATTVVDVKKHMFPKCVLIWRVYVLNVLRGHLSRMCKSCEPCTKRKGEQQKKVEVKTVGRNDKCKYVTLYNVQGIAEAYKVPVTMNGKPIYPWNWIPDLKCQ